VQQRKLASDSSTELNFIPSLLIDRQSGRSLFQFDAGGELGKRDATQQTQKTTRYYLSVAYRISF
jgi:hypothetical protein